MWVLEWFVLGVAFIAKSSLSFFILVILPCVTLHQWEGVTVELYALAVDTGGGVVLQLCAV